VIRSLYRAIKLSRQTPHNVAISFAQIKDPSLVLPRSCRSEPVSGVHETCQGSFLLAMYAQWGRNHLELESTLVIASQQPRITPSDLPTSRRINRPTGTRSCRMSEVLGSRSDFLDGKYITFWYLIYHIIHDEW
jgi:hypothetical protein